MRILFAYRVCGLGGVETAVISRAHALLDQGFRSTMSFGRIYGDGGKTLATRPDIVIQGDGSVVESIGDGKFDVVVVIDHPRLVEKIEKADLDVPVVFETHAAHLPSARPYYEAIDHKVVRGVIVPAEFSRTQVFRTTGTAKPIVVAPNPIDRSQFFRRPPKSVRKEWEALSERRVIIWVGRLEDEKRPREFLEIAGRIAINHADLAFVMVGDCPHDPSYGEAVRASVPDALQDRLEFRQFVPYEEMPMLYSLAAFTGGCLLSTSAAEAAPMTFLEAMACECPVVSTEVGGAPDLLDGGSRGWLYDAGDVAAGVRAVESALGPEQPHSRNRIVEEALQYVHIEHDPRRAAAVFGRGLKRIIRNGTPGGEQERIGHDARRTAAALGRGLKRIVRKRRGGREKARFSLRRSAASGLTTRNLPRVLAVVTTLNDEDIIAATIERLVKEGIELYMVDTGSTDDTIGEATRWLNRGLIGTEIHRVDPGAAGAATLLHRRAEICHREQADWYLYQGGDEISYGPWPGLSLLKSILHVDKLGFERIESRRITLRPVDDSFQRGRDPAVHFKFWEDTPRAESELMCWKRGTADAGRLFPIEFLTCCYPIRSSDQGRKKLAVRQDSTDAVASTMPPGDTRAPSRFIWDRSDLRRFNLDKLRLETVLDNSRTRKAIAEYEEVATFVRRLRQSMDVENDWLSRGLRLVGSKKPSKPA